MKKVIVLTAVTLMAVKALEIFVTNLEQQSYDEKT